MKKYLYFILIPFVISCGNKDASNSEAIENEGLVQTVHIQFSEKEMLSKLIEFKRESFLGILELTDSLILSRDSASYIDVLFEAQEQLFPEERFIDFYIADPLLFTESMEGTILKQAVKNTLDSEMRKTQVAIQKRLELYFGQAISIERNDFEFVIKIPEDVSGMVKNVLGVEGNLSTHLLVDHPMVSRTYDSLQSLVLVVQDSTFTYVDSVGVILAKTNCYDISNNYLKAIKRFNEISLAGENEGVFNYYRGSPLFNLSGIDIDGLYPLTKEGIHYLGNENIAHTGFWRNKNNGFDFELTWDEKGFSQLRDFGVDKSSQKIAVTLDGKLIILEDIANPVQNGQVVMTAHADSIALNALKSIIVGGKYYIKPKIKFL